MVHRNLSKADEWIRINKKSCSIRVFSVGKHVIQSAIACTQEDGRGSSGVYADMKLIYRTIYEQERAEIIEHERPAYIRIRDQYTASVYRR
mgnify:CR=1 FL=1